MWQELVLVHREGAKDCSPLTGKGGQWRTCLREILFLDPGTELPACAHNSHFYRGTAAHRFLMEICSGLRSPLFGETEVHGQFHEFRGKQLAHRHWDSLFDAVDEDVRKVRRSFLTNVGSQSYGSLARRHLTKGAKVILVGAGRLSQDLLPWLTECSVVLAARNPDKALGLEVDALVPLTTLEQPHLSFIGASWVLAAPVANADLQRWWDQNPAGLVLDFRGEQSFSAKPTACQNYLSLQDLFRELEDAKQLHESRRQEALAFARELTERREHAVLHRPFGWEDAFA